LSCLFCDIASGKIPTPFIYEDKDIVVIKDKYPKSAVHLLVIPKRHIENLLFVTAKHQALLGQMMLLLKDLAKAQGIDSFKTVVNTGEKSGQEIFHLHLHLLG